MGFSKAASAVPTLPHFAWRGQPHSTRARDRGETPLQPPKPEILRRYATHAPLKADRPKTRGFNGVRKTNPYPPHIGHHRLNFETTTRSTSASPEPRINLQTSFPPKTNTAKTSPICTYYGHCQLLPQTSLRGPAFYIIEAPPLAARFPGSGPVSQLYQSCRKLRIDRIQTLRSRARNGGEQSLQNTISG